MKIKIKDLTGAALDWAVAKCEGYECEFGDEVSGPWLVPQEGYLHDEKPLASFRPSTDWAQSGPIIERERLQLITELGDEMWVCSSPKAVEIGGYRKYCFASGPTPLIAAMRCYCSFKLGDEVDVPEELLK